MPWNTVQEDINEEIWGTINSLQKKVDVLEDTVRELTRKIYQLDEDTELNFDKPLGE